MYKFQKRLNMDEKENRIKELAITCDNMKRVIDEQAKAILHFTEIIDTIRNARQKCDVEFNDECYSSYVTFDGGVVLFK